MPALIKATSASHGHRLPPAHHTVGALCLLMMWLLRLPFCVARKSQWGHLKGFSPVCARMWRRRKAGATKFLPQYPHT